MIRSHHLPLLASDNHQITSPPTDSYNCIAWAACDSERFWWPSPGTPSYWPDGVEQAETLEAFRAAFESLGFVECDSSEHEDGVQRIALYVGADGVPTHAARQLLDGGWTSKLGRAVDIRHATANAVCGPLYGEIAIYMSRPRDSEDPCAP
ncbi:DUF7689 domain-containing protein [Nocardioides sp. CPCC 206347]|uniref:DUF7689 domain-containing protein n=1 Tax=unclassified Nocardioides TaxID=2615069 RepID=UPI003B43BCC4